MAEMNQLEGRKLISSILPTLTGQLSQFWHRVYGSRQARLVLTPTNRLGEVADPPTTSSYRTKPTVSILPQAGVCCPEWDLECAEEKCAFLRCWADPPFLFMHQPSHMWHIIPRVTDNSMWTIQNMGANTQANTLLPALVHPYKTQLGMIL